MNFPEIKKKEQYGERVYHIHDNIKSAQGTPRQISVKLWDFKQKKKKTLKFSIFNPEKLNRYHHAGTQIIFPL